MLLLRLALWVVITAACTGCVEQHVIRHAVGLGCSAQQLKVFRDEQGLYRVSGCEQASQLACSSAWSDYTCYVPSPYAEECAALSLAGHKLPAQPFPTSDTPSAEGEHKEEVKRLIAGQSQVLTKCFDCAIKAFPAEAGPRVGGTILTAFAIDASGRVSSASARSVSIAPELAYCVLGALSQVRFRAQPANVVFPFLFDALQ